MSFYFTFQTDAPFPTLSLLEALRDPAVAWVGDEPGDKVFFDASRSLRGVCVYGREDGFEIGLNAFTPMRDAELTRDIVVNVSRILDCPAMPETEGTALSHDALSDFCDAGWIAERYAEARSVARVMQEKPAEQQLKIMGYRRPYAVSKARMDGLLARGMTEDDAIALLMDEGIIVQSIDEQTDIYVPSILDVTADIEKVKKGLFGQKTFKQSESFSAFTLPPGVRTLTPVFMGDGDEYVIMGDTEYGYRRVPYETIKTYGRSVGAREYGSGIFDLTVDGDPYNDLYWPGEAM